MTIQFLCGLNRGGSLKGVAGSLYTDVITMLPRYTERISMLFRSSVCIDSTVVLSFTKIALPYLSCHFQQYRSFRSLWAGSFVVCNGFLVSKEHCIYA